MKERVRKAVRPFQEETFGLLLTVCFSVSIALSLVLIVQNIFKKIYKEKPIVPLTWNLIRWNWLPSANFLEVNDNEPKRIHSHIQIVQTSSQRLDEDGSKFNLFRLLCEHLGFWLTHATPDRTHRHHNHKLVELFNHLCHA